MVVAWLWAITIVWIIVDPASMIDRYFASKSGIEQEATLWLFALSGLMLGAIYVLQIILIWWFILGTPTINLVILFLMRNRPATQRWLVAVLSSITIMLCVGHYFGLLDQGARVGASGKSENQSMPPIYSAAAPVVSGIDLIPIDCAKATDPDDIEVCNMPSDPLQSAKPENAVKDRVQ